MNQYREVLCTNVHAFRLARARAGEHIPFRCLYAREQRKACGWFYLGGVVTGGLVGFIACNLLGYCA